MRVRMMTTRVAAPNGRDQQTFQAGAVYDVPEELARGWLASGKAEEDKMIDPVPETKPGGLGHSFGPPVEIEVLREPVPKKTARKAASKKRAR